MLYEKENKRKIKKETKSARKELERFFDGKTEYLLIKQKIIWLNDQYHILSIIYYYMLTVMFKW